MKIDVGSGERPEPGYVHVDPYWSDVDVQAYADRLPFEDDSVDEVRCSHVLEHLDRNEGIRALDEFWRVLRPRGVLNLEVPDIEVLGEEPDRWMQYIYGGQHGQGDYHHWGYTQRSLGDRLFGSGFESGLVTQGWSERHACPTLSARWHKP